MDIITALAAISQALDGVKKLREIEKDFDAATYKLQIAELASTLADAKIGILEIQKEVENKDTEIARLREASQFQGRLIRHRGFDYEGLNGEPVGSPFCPVCLANDFVHMRLARDDDGRRGAAFCPRCRSPFSRIEFLRYDTTELSSDDPPRP